jgi:hypothetical protein
VSGFLDWWVLGGSGWVRVDVVGWNETIWDGMGRCVMIVRIACAIFSFFWTVGIGLWAGG